MSELPHDISDLYLAPVMLELEARISELAALSDEQLAFEVALESNEPDLSPSVRRDAILQTLRRRVDLHGWELSWDDRGIRLARANRSLVLGISANIHRYVDGT